MHNPATFGVNEVHERTTFLQFVLRREDASGRVGGDAPEGRGRRNVSIHRGQLPEAPRGPSYRLSLSCASAGGSVDDLNPANADPHDIPLPPYHTCPFYTLGHTLSA